MPRLMCFTGTAGCRSFEVCRRFLLFTSSETTGRASRSCGCGICLCVVQCRGSSRSVKGFLVHSARAMAEAIPEAAALSRGRVRQLAVARFSSDRIVERYEELYLWLCTSATDDKYLGTMWPSLTTDWFQKEPTGLGGCIFVLRWCRQQGLVPLERYIGLLVRWTVFVPLGQFLELLRSHLHWFLSIVFARDRMRGLIGCCLQFPEDVRSFRAGRCWGCDCGVGKLGLPGRPHVFSALLARPV
jgi:hypothetical protein